MNNDNESIYIAPCFQVTLFKGAVTSKKKMNVCCVTRGRHSQTGTMMDQFVANLLNKYLGKYIQNLESENLNVGIFNGKMFSHFRSTTACVCGNVFVV